MNALTIISRGFPSPALVTVRRFASATVVMLLALTGSARLAAAANTPQQVVVTNPVEVLGSVEVVGEPFKQPFAMTQSVTVSAGSQNKILPLPLPAGKRIVIESISVHTWVPTGAKAFGWVQLQAKQAGANSGNSALQFLEQGSLSGQTLFTSVTPAGIRINTDSQNLQVNVYRVNSLASFDFAVSVFGYIESL